MLIVSKSSLKLVLYNYTCMNWYCSFVDKLSESKESLTWLVVACMGLLLEVSLYPVTTRAHRVKSPVSEFSSSSETPLIPSTWLGSRRPDPDYSSSSVDELRRKLEEDLRIIKRCDTTSGTVV